MNETLATAILVILCAIPIAYGAYLLERRGNYTLWESILFAFVYSFCRIMWRVQVTVDPQFSSMKEQGVIFVANHRSSMDPFFIQIAAGRRVHWMVAGEYCRHFLFGPILKIFQVIPTNRGGVDTASTKQAIRLTQSGKWIGMFPEGRINRTPDPLVSVRPGAGLVAIRGSAVIVPIWIEGAPTAGTVWGPLFKIARVRVTIGAPISQPEGKAESSDQDIARLWIEQAMNQVSKLGGYPEFKVQMAGKRWVDE